MEELVMKGPDRFGREKEVKVLLGEAEVLGATEKGLEGRRTDREEWGKDVAFKLHLWDGSGQEGSVSLAAGLRWSRRNVTGRQRVWIAEGRRQGGDSGGMAPGRVAVRR